MLLVPLWRLLDLVMLGLYVRMLKHHGASRREIRALIIAAARTALSHHRYSTLRGALRAKDVSTNEELWPLQGRASHPADEEVSASDAV